jgi:hypothetical protein
MQVVCDIDAATRIDKVLAIARNETALKHLRVCWQNPHGAYNCGRCEKCMRTMVALKLAGVLDRCRTFDAPLDLQAVARLAIDKPARRQFYEDMLRVAPTAPGNNAEVIRAIERALIVPPPPSWLRKQARRAKRAVLGWFAHPREPRAAQPAQRRITPVPSSPPARLRAQ